MRLDCRIIDVALLVIRDLCLVLAVVALRIELSVTALSGPSGQPVLDYLVQSGASESNRNPPAPKAGVLPSAPPPDFQSERSESNRRSLGPQPSAIPSFATFCFLVTRVGVEPNLIGLKDR
jgi:hypothetical protein